MEFKRVAFDGEHRPVIGPDGEPVTRVVTDAAGKPVLEKGKPVTEVVTEYLPVSGNVEVFETNQRFADLDPKLFAAAIKEFKDFRIEKLEHAAGGPVVVRARREGGA